ncbi:helix-turn-helix domain-containing protein [Tsukamurella sputi]|uniref:Helix-turn-helix domain-containing protein n=1 Tax=Tsukamurella sputi TaxID=2591848 RepID=A0A5C5RJC0_9ACTN|nr:helix-turn-helix domain-containing protein [Tsukamurella sputi]
MSIELATPKEAAAALRTTEASLAQDRYRNRGLPYVKAGKRVLYRWSDVQAYLDANTINPGVA